jgi:hypothetical protein
MLLTRELTLAVEVELSLKISFAFDKSALENSYKEIKIKSIYCRMLSKS